MDILGFECFFDYFLLFTATHLVFGQTGPFSSACPYMYMYMYMYMYNYCFFFCEPFQTDKHMQFSSLHIMHCIYVKCTQN